MDKTVYKIVAEDVFAVIDPKLLATLAESEKESLVDYVADNMEINWGEYVIHYVLEWFRHKRREEADTNEN